MVTKEGVSIMAIYVNVPSFNINENDIEATQIKYTNIAEPEVSTVNEMLDSLQQNKVTTIPGKGLSTNDFTNEYKQRIDNIRDQIVFSTYAEFPTIGQEDILYIDKQQSISYLWDSVSKTYTSVTFDQNDYVIQSVL